MVSYDEIADPKIRRGLSAYWQDRLKEYVSEAGHEAVKGSLSYLAQNPASPDEAKVWSDPVVMQRTIQRASTATLAERIKKGTGIAVADATDSIKDLGRMAEDTINTSSAKLKAQGYLER